MADRANKADPRRTLLLLLVLSAGTTVAFTGVLVGSSSRRLCASNDDDDDGLPPHVLFPETQFLAQQTEQAKRDAQPFSFLKNSVKSAAGAARSGVTQVVTQGGSGIQSVAQLAGSGISKAAQATTSTVQSVAGAAQEGVSKVVSKGNADLQSASKAARSGVDQVAAQGSSDWQSAAQVAGGIAQSAGGLAQAAGSGVAGLAQSAGSGVSEFAQSAGGLAQTAGSGVSEFAQTAGSGISGLAQTATTSAISTGSSLGGALQQGQSQAVNLALWMDSQAKEGASAANTKAKTAVLKFTGKNQYMFGDISKEVLRRIQSDEYDTKDIMLLLRVLLMTGAKLTPLAKFLPLTILLEVLNGSIEQQLGASILEVLTKEVDERFRDAFTAEELGDVTKRSLLAGVVAFTGKDQYEAGDIEETVMATTQNASETSSSPLLDLQVGPEFADWDQTLRESVTGDIDTVMEESLTQQSSTEPPVTAEALDKKFVQELDDWDKKFQSLYPDGTTKQYA